MLWASNKVAGLWFTTLLLGHFFCLDHLLAYRVIHTGMDFSTGLAYLSTVLFGGYALSTVMFGG
jgi:hypothetical protein